MQQVTIHGRPMHRVPDEEVTVHLYPSGRFAVGAYRSPEGVMHYEAVEASELPQPHVAVEDLKGAVVHLVDMRAVGEGVPLQARDG